MKQGKIWGETEVILKTPCIEVHRITIEPYMKCSMHKHNHKWNAFYVLDGELSIITEKNDYDLTDRTELFQGDFTTVKPGEYHQFETGEFDCVALEIYYPEKLSEDIVRKTVGGHSL